MMRGPALVVRLAALSGFLAVAFGAFAAHGAKDARAAELLHTGSLYQMTHALAVFGWLAVRQAGQDRAGGKVSVEVPSLFLAGTVLFSGSLYALAFGAPRALGLVTPFGGLCFLAGWLLLAWRAGTIEDRKA
ncbi:uncharacterized membrane protein YgdD (TMEM256/DUF423 family) [Caulobacter rhizosphaerae]|uniref:Uncharacterized membrane protein YgdD (TMEM256/DUF423 family) n=1 Tax=Caulobacter rhizosphaerae TaxID=2010972 RepID=A0ABU1N4N2_9CAUL|nr:DUF423 domain-containing protein [Caulobacter rhizosphaerae]MDR6533393.1 uncharacterized membrane protein YgdD (TMEM256/DUF423 family) [Caulobacter rhizosphaerae]